MTGPIKVEDPELYYAFLRAHTKADLQIQAATSAVASQLSTSTAALYHINAAELTRLTTEVRKYNVNLGALYLDEQNYLHQLKVAKKQPDINVMMNYQWQRRRLVRSAHSNIHAALSQTSWSGLYT